MQELLIIHYIFSPRILKMFPALLILCYCCCFHIFVDYPLRVVVVTLWGYRLGGLWGPPLLLSWNNVTVQSWS